MHHHLASEASVQLDRSSLQVAMHGASVVHHIIQQCRSLHLALQADYAKLQAAYQAMKRQSAQPHPAAAVPLAAPAPPSDSFLKLQVLLAAAAASLPLLGIRYIACYTLSTLVKITAG